MAKSEEHPTTERAVPFLSVSHLSLSVKSNVSVSCERIGKKAKTLF